MNPNEEARMQELEGQVTRYRSRIVRLKAALQVAVGTIRTWHGITMPAAAEREAWTLYQSSPEMQKILTALAQDIEPS